MSELDKVQRRVALKEFCGSVTSSSEFDISAWGLGDGSENERVLVGQLLPDMFGEVL